MRYGSRRREEFPRSGVVPLDLGRQIAACLDELAVAGGARQQIDCRARIELVGLGPPAEPARIEPARRFDHLHTRLEGTKAAPVRASSRQPPQLRLAVALAGVRHVHHRAADDLPRVLVKHRPEMHGHERDTRQVERVQLLGERNRVEPGRPEDLEGARRASPLRQVRAFQKTHSRVDERRGG